MMLHTAFDGFQLGECLVRCAVGLPVDPCLPTRPPSRFAASVNLYPTMEGVLTHVAPPPPSPSLVTCFITQKVGANVAPPPKSFFLLCWMVAQGKTEQEAIDAIREATEKFEQEIQSAQ